MRLESNNKIDTWTYSCEISANSQLGQWPHASKFDTVTSLKREKEPGWLGESTALPI